MRPRVRAFSNQLGKNRNRPPVRRVQVLLRSIQLAHRPLVEVVAGVWVLEHPQLLPLDLRELRLLHHRVVLALTISLSKTVVLLSLLLVLVHLLGQQVRVLLVVRMQALLR